MIAYTSKGLSLAQQWYLRKCICGEMKDMSALGLTEQANICRQNATVFDLWFTTPFIDRNAVAPLDEITLTKHAVDYTQPARRDNAFVGENHLEPWPIYGVNPRFWLVTLNHIW